MIKYSFVILLSVVLLACHSTKKKNNGPEILWDEMEVVEDTLASTIDLTKPKVFHGSETIFHDLIHTTLKVSFDWEKAWLIGEAKISAKPHFYDQDSLILDAKGMEIKSVKIFNKDLNFIYANDFIRIKLDKTYSKKDTFEIIINYVAKPNERLTSGSAAISSDKGLYFINHDGKDKGKMPQIWTQGETEASSVWFPTIDAPNVKTTQEMFITVDDKYVTLSNGEFLGAKKNNDGTRTDHWLQKLPHAPYLFMMGVGEFKVVKDSYKRKNGSIMEVNYYVEPEWENSAKAIFGETPKMIAFFSDLTGVEYPWDKYHQIVVRDYVSGAMENTGAVVFGEYVYKNKRELLDGDDNSTIAHELFHHWFGDLVTCESWSNLPLNESFANYSQYLWDEFRYGKDEADYQAEIEKNGYYQSAQYGGHHNLIWYDYNDKEQMFDGHSYNKGGRILHMLRTYLGDEAFFAGLKLYLKTNQFKAAEFHHLRQAFEEVSGQDLTWFFKQWFEASNHPKLDVIIENDTLNSKAKLTVYQNQDLGVTPLYRLPIKVQIDAENVENKSLFINELKSEFEFQYVGKLNNVIFDVDQSLLAEIDEDKTQEMFIYQYYNSDKYLLRKNALIEGMKKPELAKAQQMVVDALVDPFWGIRLIACEKIEQLDGEFKVQALNKLKDIVQLDPKSDVRDMALEQLCKDASPFEKEQYCISSIKNDSSYMVVSQALRTLSQVNNGLALNYAKKLENEPSKYILSEIAQIYTTNGDEKSYDFYRKILIDKPMGGYEGIIALNSYSYYTSKQGLNILKKAKSTYKEIYEVGGTYTKMFLPQNVEFLSNQIKQKVKEKQEQITYLEKNNKGAEADVIKLELNDYNIIITELDAYYSEIKK